MTFDWKKTIGAIAPTIGTALGGPLGGLAGAALASVLGVENDPEQIGAAVANATPEQLLAIRQADNQFKLQMAELGFKSVADLEKIAADDRANARSREIALNDWMPKALGLLVVAGFFGVIGLLVAYGLPKSGSDSLLVLVGALGAAFGSIVQYYYGSSAGSAAKSRAIEQLKSST
ncbi:hypothetical protein [Chitinibacter tainanensis]|uniref:hypothetical protein n=1 Tax=Chitinibacter tainanensis TaxID=230667 RepID=UPI002354AA1D|nr:hypothetical protein [Chitinibacter tainanensis]